MASFPQRLRSPRFAVSLTVVLLLGLVVGTVIGTSRKVPVTIPAQDGLPLVTSTTSAIRVVALERSSIGNSPILHISLQNISPKTIKAYSVGSGKGWLTRSYYFAETAFQPNAIETQIIPLNSGSFKGASREFVISGVVFDDGSTDGQATSVFRLRENWLGLHDYTSQLLPCLHRLRPTFAAQDEASLATCETQADRELAQGKSADYEDGFQTAKRESLTRLGEIKNKLRSGDFASAAKQRDKMVKILEAFERR